MFIPTRHKLSVEDYHKLGEVGILTEDSRVELIERDGAYRRSLIWGS